eukprot:Unigene3375_Nuclearia_a/m.10351 Unigene3375_Nuclearia_a/g.10351  ORF Unigene3375_Nuclearia_a/g.10351 Unigene3375_Nuclearia_a/m.10351 type:complete len:176 (+) Unigene3375_Nuclearia_a:952-1479(+)
MMLAAESAPPASAPVEVNELQPVLTVFCVDTSPEMDVEMGPYVNASKPRLQWLRLLIARFVRARALVSAAHQTALMTFAAQATWLCDFTNDAAVIERKLGEVALASHDECKTFDVLTAVEMACVGRRRPRSRSRSRSRSRHRSRRTASRASTPAAATAAFCRSSCCTRARAWSPW